MADKVYMRNSINTRTRFRELGRDEARTDFYVNNDAYHVGFYSLMGNFFMGPDKELLIYDYITQA